MNTYDSPEGRANVAAIESKLKELDEVFRQFCSREGYTFCAMVDLWPRRRVWCRQEIDRCMDLTMTIGIVGVQNVLDRGFYPELPWSLSASGSLAPGTYPGIHILSRPVLDQVPFSQVSSELAESLGRGLQILNTMTKNEILSRGEKCGRRAEPGTAPNGGPAASVDNSNTPDGPPSVS